MSNVFIVETNRILLEPIHPGRVRILLSLEKAIRAFLAKKPNTLKYLLTTSKVPQRDASVVNAMRWVFYERLAALGLPVECGSRGLKKYHRATRELPKSRWIDAACVATPVTGIHCCDGYSYTKGERRAVFLLRPKA